MIPTTPGNFRMDLTPPVERGYVLKHFGQTETYHETGRVIRAIDVYTSNDQTSKR